MTLTSNFYDNNINYVPSKLGTLIYNEGGSVNLASGYTNTIGFYVAVLGDEGLLKVKLQGKSNYVVLPFFKGWNPVLIEEIDVDAGNTATNVYYGY